MADVADNEELIATRKLHGLNDGLFEDEKVKRRELNDLEDFADLLRPEQRYYTNIIKKLVENARNRVGENE